MVVGGLRGADDSLGRLRVKGRAHLRGSRARVRLQVQGGDPVVCGAAMDVPVSLAVAVSLVFHAEVMPTPGANQSTQSPKFAQNGFLSFLFVALIVIASVTRAGEVVQASWGIPIRLPLPAASA